MDREALLNSLPVAQQFAGMMNVNKKTVVEEFIGRILDAMAAEQREPDLWETQDLGLALGLLAARLYDAALGSAIHALTDPEQRAPITNPVDYGGPPPTGQQLRAALDQVSLIPAKGY